VVGLNNSTGNPTPQAKEHTLDIYCVKCGEPWDMDSLHEEADARRANDPESEGRPYEEVYAEVRAGFFSDGCIAVGGTCSTPSTATDRTYGLRPQDASAALSDILGDDTDGIAAMMEDMGF
jgi:hypothetical protein